MKQELIGLTGYAGSGKSECAKALEERGFVRHRFAAPIKAMLRALLEEFCVDDETIERMLDGDLKEVPTPLLNGKTPRYAMQTLGTEWGRKLIGENLWVDAAITSAKATMEWDTDVSVVFDDVRFQNELEAICSAGGKVVRLVRSGVGVNLSHESERQIGDLPVDAIVLNNGAIEDTAQAVLGCRPLRPDEIEPDGALEEDACETVEHRHEAVAESDVKEVTIAGLEGALDFAKSNDQTVAVVVVAKPGARSGEYEVFAFKSMSSALASDLVEEAIRGIDAANAERLANMQAARVEHPIVALP